MKKTFLLLTALLIMLSSCEGVKMTSGIVVSETTGKPMENVEINVLNNVGDSTKTNSSGTFILNTGFTGMMFGGPKFRFEVKSEGYDTQIIETKFDLDTIKLIAQ